MSFQLRSYGAPQLQHSAGYRATFPMSLRDTTIPNGRSKVTCAAGETLIAEGSEGLV
jgi:hypothetical protein